jgi:archaemetzincin
VEAKSGPREVPGLITWLGLQGRPTIAIQPLGTVDRSLIHSVTNHVQSVFRAEVVELPARPLPRSAYYRPRSRYRGERVLADLEARTPAGMTKVLGIMSRDLSVTRRNVHDWGVLGVAGLSCRAAVVSVHRLGGTRAARLETRLNRVATHELGHTFGLSHCHSAGCIMNDARGTIRTVDRSSGRFCSSCAGRLRGLLQDREV